jgi:hypothetical protein
MELGELVQMNNEQRAAIEAECCALIIAITQHGDHGEHAQAAALFAKDGSWLRGGRRYTGPDEILKSYKRGSSTQVTRHINGGTRVTVRDEDRADSVTYYLAISDDPGTPDASLPMALKPFSMGEWHDSFVRTPEGWRFASRATMRLFERAEA